MSKTRRCGLLVFLAIAGVSMVAATGGPDVIEPGETVRAEMPPGAFEETSVEFEFVAASDGPTTIETFTLEFDTWLAVFRLGEGDAEERIARDDDGGEGWNSRVVIEATRGERYRLTVRSRDEWGGPFELRVTERAPDDPGPEVERERELIYWDSLDEEAERSARPLFAARAHLGRGELFLDERSYEDAVHELEAARRMFGELLGPTHARTMHARIRLAEPLAKTDQPDRAVALLEENVALAEASGDPRQTVTSLLTLGWFLKFQVPRRGVEALVPLRRALRLLESVHGSESPEIIPALRLMTRWNSYHYNDLAAAPELIEEQQQLLERWIRMLETKHGPDAPQLGEPLTRLGWLQHYRNKAAIEGYLVRALDVLEGAGDEYRSSLAMALHEYGHYLANNRAYDRAEPLLKRAMEIWNLDAENSLAFLYYRSGRYEEAKEMSLKLLHAQEQERGFDDPFLLGILNILRMITCRLGELEECQHYIERKIRIHERYPGSGFGLLSNKMTLSALLRRRGRTKQARSVLDEVLEGVRPYVETGDAPSFLLIPTLEKLSRALQTDGRADEAEEINLLLVGEQIRAARMVCRGLPEVEALEYVSTEGPRRSHDVALTVLAERHNPSPGLVRQIWEAVIRGRGLVLDEMSMRQRMAFRSADEEVRKLAAEVTAARERLAYLTVVPPPGVGKSEGYEDILAIARQAKEEAESKLAERSVEFVNLMAGSRAGYAAVAKARPPDTDLVAFVKYEVTHWERLAKFQTSGVSYLAFGLAAGREEPFVVPLGSAFEIDPLVKEWREHASAPEGSDPAADERRLEIGRALRRRVWDPVRARLGKAARVFIVPDGDLHLVNFSALPTDDDRYLVETGPLLHYLSVERDLALEPLRAATESLLALGGPDFEEGTGGGARDAPPDGSPEFLRGRRSSCGDFRTLRFEPLPGTKREVEAIAQLWSRSGDDRNATLLTGRSAEETTFKAQAMEHRYLHVATHGFFLGQECLAAADATRGIGGLAKREDLAERLEAPQRDASDPTERAKELERAGRWPEALELYRRAVEFRERVHGPKDPRVAASLVRLAVLTRKDHDDYGLEVRPLLERAAAIDPASLSGEASVLQKILDSKYRSAEDEARALLATVEEVHGADSIEAAQVMELLAEAMGKGGTGDDPEMVRLAERVLAIKKAVYGSEHVAVALSLNNLGMRMGEAGRDPVERLELYEQAIDILKRTVGAHHWLVSASLFNIGFAAPTREEKIAALVESANITHRYGASGAWYTAETVSHLKRLVSDPAELRELLDPGILPPDENPLLRSGLALAGADRRDQTGPDDDDGILTAEEIASLDLSGVEWAVLSACDTGVGDVKAGEGVFGLRRAFRIAGARTLIMSLWSVDDESTREWMTALYDARLREGMSTAEAVRHASLSVLEARRKAGQSTHPFHWAAFVAAGDWR